MDDQTIEPQGEEVTEEIEETEEAPEPSDDLDTLKAQLKKYEERGITQRERTRALKAEIEKLKKAVVPKDAPHKENKGELDETQLDYLDLKGVSEPEDIDLIQKVVTRTGQTVRQALKDEYVQEKLKANQAKRELKSATPSNTKRASGGQSDDLAAAIAKYEASGFKELPSDFKLRAAVVDAVMDRQAGNKPAWH